MTEHELETRLRELRPAGPSTSLEQRIAEQLSGRQMVVARPAALTSGTLPRPERRARPTWLTSLAWATAGAFAVFTGMLVMRGLGYDPVGGAPTAQVAAANASAAAAPVYFEPAESSRQVLAAEDAGVTYDATEAEPRQQTYYTSLDRYVWRNPATGAEVTVEVPRQDFVISSVSYQ